MALSKAYKPRIWQDLKVTQNWTVRPRNVRFSLQLQEKILTASGELWLAFNITQSGEEP